MKVRLLTAALLTLLTVTACSSSTTGKGNPADGGSSTPPTSPGTSVQSGSGSNSAPATTSTSNGGGSSAAFCTKLVQAQTKLGDLSTSISDPSKAKDILNEEAAVFSDLEKNAPSEIAPAVHDLATVIAAAATYLQNPGSGSPSALQDLSTKLPADIEKLSTYVAANCH